MTNLSITSSKHDIELENIIKNKLATLNPTHLELIDESHKHIGHAGVAERGGRHYSLTISSPNLNNLSRIKQHQAVFSLLGDLMTKDDNKPCLVHALKIKVI